MGLTKIQQQLLETSRAAARDLREHGRSLTDLIGELSACHHLDLTWQPTKGHDALDSDGRRVQVKTRRSWTTPKVNPSGRLGRFGRKAGYLFEVGLLVELDDRFDVEIIRKMDVDSIRELEAKEKGQRGLHVSTFRSGAKTCAFWDCDEPIPSDHSEQVQ